MYGTDDLKSRRGTALVVLSVSGVLFVCCTPEPDLWGWLHNQNSLVADSETEVEPI